MADSGRRLVLRHALAQPGAVWEEKLRLSDARGLLDLCAAHAKGAAFVQVQVTGASGGRRHALALDFGHVGRAEQDVPVEAFWSAPRRQPLEGR